MTILDQTPEADHPDYAAGRDFDWQDLSAADLAEYAAWCREYDDRILDERMARDEEPTAEDRAWWTQTTADIDATVEELGRLTAADWADVERMGERAYEAARDRGDDRYEAAAERDQAEAWAIRFWLGERARPI